ncbi:MBL fold metallo-hydrolase [Dechloromonas sp. HYN0024]|uniref:MBL fold metallo-hydrolase n=1 Tax=Dechloromonas sp. HYN0024 TaxID=2231055 RepID=UPI000E451EEB|nr:MBL fold metallo-hydrolase [Dechloromonas sp. HYN0024]AXS79242.1 MBL fold metallo-hydrolase [Dechloromonas sp. HYN0024]
MIRFASLGSGSAGNALLVEHGASCLMLDCGFGLRETVARLQRLGRAPSDLAGILVTHEHGDHVSGVFRLARKFGLPVWMTHGTWVGCRESDNDLDLRIIDSHRALSIGDIEVQAFPVPHDAREPVQYVFSGAGCRLGVLTDIGEPTAHVCAMLSGCAGLVLEFNHDATMLERSAYPASVKRRIAGRYGHLENSVAGTLLGKIDCSNLQALVLAHLSERNNHPELALGAATRALGYTAEWIGVASADQGFDWRSIG